MSEIHLVVVRNSRSRASHLTPLARLNSLLSRVEIMAAPRATPQQIFTLINSTPENFDPKNFDPQKI